MGLPAGATGEFARSGLAYLPSTCRSAESTCRAARLVEDRGAATLALTTAGPGWVLEGSPPGGAGRRPDPHTASPIGWWIPAPAVGRGRVWLAMLAGSEPVSSCWTKPLAALDVAHRVEVLALVKQLMPPAQPRGHRRSRRSACAAARSAGGAARPSADPAEPETEIMTGGDTERHLWHPMESFAIGLHDRAIAMRLTGAALEPFIEGGALSAPVCCLPGGGRRVRRRQRRPLSPRWSDPMAITHCRRCRAWHAMAVGDVAYRAWVGEPQLPAGVMDHRAACQPSQGTAGGLNPRILLLIARWRPSA